jgi:NifU-like protein involved in Fe-S cluster formation
MLYTTDILRLAASLPEFAPLERVDGAATLRSATCGSSITTQLAIDDEGRITGLSQQVSACAFGQAAAALVAASALGRDREAVAVACEAVSAWLSSCREDPGEWPGLSALSPARSRRSRHAAVQLPFAALAAALAQAEGRPR